VPTKLGLLLVNRSNLHWIPLVPPLMTYGYQWELNLGLLGANQWQ